MEEGEESQNFITRSEIAFNEAKFDDMTEEEHKVLNVIELKRKLLQIKDTTIIKVKEFTNTYQEAKHMANGMSGDLSRVNRHDNYRGNG